MFAFVFTFDQLDFGPFADLLNYAFCHNENFGSGPGKNLYFAVRNDWPELVTIINKGLASISEKEREAIKQKWIAVTIEKQIDYTLLYKVFAGVICFGLVFRYLN